MTPLNGWILCKKRKPITTRASGLFLPKDMDKEVVTEGVADVVAVSDPCLHTKTDVSFPCPVSPGDVILYRGFLRFANQVGEHVGLESSDAFLLRVEDILAVLEPEGPPVSVGFYGEYEV